MKPWSRRSFLESASCGLGARLLGKIPLGTMHAEDGADPGNSRQTRENALSSGAVGVGEFTGELHRRTSQVLLQFPAPSAERALAIASFSIALSWDPFPSAKEAAAAEHLIDWFKAFTKERNDMGPTKHWSRRSFLQLATCAVGVRLAGRAAIGSVGVTYPLKWKIQTGLENDGVVAGEVDGDLRIFVASQVFYNSSPPPHAGFLSSLGPSGGRVFKKEADGGGISVFPNFLEPRGIGPSIFYASGPSTPGSVGEARLVSARDGQIIWSMPTTNQFYGNGCCVMADVDGDGIEELVHGDTAAVRCFRARDGELKWVYDDRIAICWGRMACGDINGDGKPELVLGTEYANKDHSSSLLALDGRGKLLWRRDGIRGDMGSTPAVIVDVDGDNRPEILKVELDLLNQGKMPWGGLYCFRGDGSIKYRADFGCSGMAVGDIDGDGVPEAVGITSSRDGGSLAVDRNEIRCIDLESGKLKWTTRVSRSWLGSQDPLIADLSGNGKLDVLVTTSNPSGYGYRKGQPAYGDAYIVNPHGEIIWRETLADYILAPFVSDVDRDGRNEIVLACHDGSVRCYATPGKPGKLWSVTGANLHRTYAVTTS